MICRWRFGVRHVLICMEYCKLSFHFRGVLIFLQFWFPWIVVLVSIDGVAAVDAVLIFMEF